MTPSGGTAEEKEKKHIKIYINSLLTNMKTSKLLHALAQKTLEREK